MTNSKIYSMNDIDCYTQNGKVFVMAFDGEDRSYYGWNKLQSNGSKFETLLVMSYDRELLKKKSDLICIEDKVKCIVIDMPTEQSDFVDALIEIDELSHLEELTIDISCMKTPSLFVLMKYLKILGNVKKIAIINTIPYDYIFEEQPFASYKTYLGDLELREIIGYSGSDDMSVEEDLYIFLGFEGPMATKVVENTVFRELYIVNTMPSYYQKYKDVSIVNNYSLVASKGNKISFVPAGNPFEVYNTLEVLIDSTKPVCIAPLCTKPISLGICMYALDHDNVRIIYPYSEKNNGIKSREVHVSYIYTIEW